MAADPAAARTLVDTAHLRATDRAGTPDSPDDGVSPRPLAGAR